MLSTNQKTAYLTWKLSSLATCQSQSEFILSNLSMFLPNVIELKNIRKHTGEKPRQKNRQKPRLLILHETDWPIRAIDSFFESWRHF